MLSTRTLSHCLLIVISGSILVSAYPKVDKCADPVLLSDRVDTSWTEPITPGDKRRIDFSLQADEFVVFRIRTGLGNERRRLETLLEQFRKCKKGERVGDELQGIDDDLVQQPLTDDDVAAVVGCNFDLEDDDATHIEHSLGGHSHLVGFEIKDKGTGGVLSRKFSKSDFGGKLFMTTRGQKRECDRPNTLDVAGDEGDGDVAVEMDFYRRHNWNLAPVDFETAADALNQSTWCGNINWVRENDGAMCPRGDNTPKWTMRLEQNDKLLLTAVLQGHQVAAGRKPLRVMLRIYREMGGDKITDILDEDVLGNRTFHRSFVNTGSASQFYLELDHEARHLYHYQIAFQVERSCADDPSERFEVPQFAKTCGWLRASTSRSDRYCASQKSTAHVDCRETCGGCGSTPGCSEQPTDTFFKKRANCAFIRKKSATLKQKGQFDDICNGPAGTLCALACEKC